MKLFQLLILTLVFSCPIFAQASHNAWLQGVWEGRGVQNDGATWSMKLNIDNEEYLIAYPSLNCAGYWNLSSLSANKARFIERISNSSVCLDKLIISLVKISDWQLGVRFSSVVDNFTATAILHRTGVTRRLSPKHNSLNLPGNTGKSRKTSSGKIGAKALTAGRAKRGTHCLIVFYQEIFAK